MPEPLKELFAREFVARLGEAVSERDNSFDVRAFLDAVLDASWKKRELKDRMHHMSRCLYEGMSGTYRERMDVLIQVGPAFTGLPALVFPDVVETFGLDDWAVSMRALEAFTPLCSSEFAIRPFIAKDSTRAMKQMVKWSKSNHEHVRRLASEGCRPRLPWAMALPAFKKDPSPVLPILEQLRCDPSEYVRRSVANNLNDISKDHPELVLRIAQRWLKDEPSTHKLIKHACRTLLKKGDQKALALFGVGKVQGVKVIELNMKESHVPIGDAVEFCFRLQAPEKPVLLRLEYAIDFLKANGTHGRKVFKLSESQVSGEKAISRRHRVHDMTTRVHRPGVHHLHVIINGQVLAKTSFTLI